MSRPLRIAMFVGSFPVVSETFILRQVTGLLDLGHEVDVYADTRADQDALAQPEVAKYRLLERTTFMDMPAESAPWELPAWPIVGRTWLPGSATSTSNFLRVTRAVPKWLRSFAKSPRLTMQVTRRSQYGFRATSLSALYRLAKLCGISRQYDVLHAHFGPVGNSFRFARALWRVPLVVTFHGYDFCVVPRAEGNDVYRHLFQTVDAVTVNSNYTHGRVVELGCPAQRVHNLHVGVDVKEFGFQERVRNAGGSVLLITVGRLVQKKGIEFAIRAVARVRDAHPGIRYEIIGDGPLRGALEKLIADLGLRENVILRGSKDSQYIRQRMAKAHIFVLASVTADNGDQEGTPVSLMEAQATGLPVVSTRHSGIPEVVLDGQSGFLVPEGDVPALAERLLFLMKNPEVCRQLGACGRRHIEAQFDLRQLNRDLVRIYEQTAGQFRISN